MSYLNQPVELTQVILHNVSAALFEDVGDGDLTAELIDPSRQASATIVTREKLVLCGIAWVAECFRQLDENIKLTWLAEEGAMVDPGQRICEILGPANAILIAERTALNFLQTLSGTATTTRQYVNAIAGSGATIMDTRKTLPGLRRAQKYAVRVGGGMNQRLGLYDGILIKENHIIAAGGIAPALAKAMTSGVEIAAIQIEVENLQELVQALNCGAQSILLDNFSLGDLKQAVEINQGKAVLEASGGITLENVMAIAQTGVQRISIGSLTKHVRAGDFSMRFQLEKK